MEYYYLEPEVAGELGNKTIMDNSVHPPVITKLHYEFSGWVGDDIVESFPCFIITKKLSNKIKSLGFTGFQLEKVLVTKSEQFIELYPEKSLPDFVWLKITGEYGKDDFSLSSDYRLVISERVYNLLKKKFNIKICAAERVKNHT